MLCAIARIDDAARRHLTALQAASEPLGVCARPVHGHITLATYLGPDEQAFIAACKAALAQQRAFTVRYARIAALEATAIIAALPEKAGELAAVQRRIAQPWAPALDRWTQPEVWLPHTTLLYAPRGNLQAFAQAMGQDFIPFSATVGHIEFSRVTEHGYDILDTLALRR